MLRVDSEIKLVLVKDMEHCAALLGTPNRKTYRANIDLRYFTHALSFSLRVTREETEGEGERAMGRGVSVVDVSACI
jgi:shikimate kinase